MDFMNIPNEIMVYGSLFSLTNRIQTIGDNVFPNISMKQYFVLMTICLFADNPPSLREVADIVGCSYQNIKKIANILETKNYITIEKDLVDKRRYNLKPIMKNVNTIMKNFENEVNEFIKALYNGLSKQELTDTFNILTKMNNNLIGLQKKWR